MGVSYWLPLVLLLLDCSEATNSTSEPASNSSSLTNSTSASNSSSLVREFDRQSVEAPPDVIAAIQPDSAATSYSGQEEDSDGGVNTHFSRGAVEKADPETTPLQYFGAAAHYGEEPASAPGNQLQPLPNPGSFQWNNPDFYETASLAKTRGKDYFPARESVEGLPNQINLDQLRKKEYEASSSNESSYKVVCYYGAWAHYRAQPMNFDPNHINATACTHLIYSFAGLDNATSNTIVSLDNELDVVQGNYKAAVSLKKKNPALKVMIAIGGWSEGGKKYSVMASTEENRAKFVKSVVDFLTAHNFDGLDLDWEYPGAADRDGNFQDKSNFVALVEALSSAFRGQGWVLSAAVSAARFRVDEGYEVERIAKALDFINVMAYDLHGAWDNFADHHAPLFRREHDSWEFQYLNADGAISYWHEKGAPLNKLLLGTPFYGRTFTLSGASTEAATAPGAAATGPGDKGSFTEEEGFLAYYEVCLLLKEPGWVKAVDSDGNPYAVKGNQWIGYDDVASIERKMKYVKSRGLGGAMIWAVDLDDFTGACNSSQKCPLLTTMNTVLKRDDPKDMVPLTPSPPSSGSPGSAGSAATLPAGFTCPSAGLHPSPSSCTEFISCSSDLVGSVQRCADGLHFDKSFGGCNWPQAAACTIEQQQQTSYKEEEAKCASLADGLYTDPSDCRRMFWCANRVQFKLSCPEGQFFNAETATCDFYASFKCQSGVLTKVSGLTKALPPLRDYVIGPAKQYYGAASQLASTYEASAPAKGNVLCYFSNWASEREGDGNFVPENIDASLCSHVVYAFASLDSASLEIVPSAPAVDIDSGFYNRVQKVSRDKNPSVKVLLALGGWTDSSGDSYSRMVNDKDKRANFVQKAVDFVKMRNFSGLALDWQYPVCWQSDCKKGPVTDKEGFSALLKELRAAFGTDLELAVSVSGFKSVLDRGYDLSAVGQYADLVNVMTYDYHGFWDGVTGHHSPLLPRNEDKDKFPLYNAAETLEYVVEQGVPRAKIHMGIPLYGQTFTLAASNTGLGAEANARGKPAKFTNQAGMMAYFEICAGVKSLEWKKVDAVKEHGPYAYNHDQWVGFDDAEMAKTKAAFIVEKGYGGAAIWTVDLDDFNNLCCGGANPVLHAVSQTLLGTAAASPSGNNCERPPVVSTPGPLPTGTTAWDAGSGADKPRPTTPTPIATQPGSSSEAAGAKCSNEGGYTPHDKDCRKFFQCVNGNLETRECSGDLLWNPKTNTCDWKDNVECKSDSASNAAAEGVRADESVKSESGSTDGEYSEGGEGEEHGQVSCQGSGQTSVPEDCASYFTCVSGKRYRRQCAPGLHWAVARASCDWPEHANCTTTKKYAQTDAACSGADHKADPATCEGYLVCVHDNLVARPCGGGLHWNDNKKICDFPQEAGCDKEGAASSSPSSSTTTTTSAPEQEKPATTSSPKEEEKEEVVPIKGPLSGDYKMVCYFTNWAVYRPAPGKFDASHIDPTLCTHIVYGFAVLDPSNLIIKSHDPWADFEEYGHMSYEKVTAYRKQGVKVTLALGGWNDSEGDKYSRLVNDPAARKRFNEHVIDFIEKYNFDGLDLDWEYPACWQTDCKDEHASDKQGFAAWVSELSALFKPKNLLLSAAVSPSKKVMDFGYDIPSIARDLDWIAVMAYDYHGHWDKRTGHVAPMFEHPDDEFYYFNVNYTINYWLSSGSPPEKLVLGLPLYGQAFTLDDASEHGLNAKAGNKGSQGEFTRQAGFLAYYEICHDVDNQAYTVVQDDKGRMGPYAYKDKQWVSYDDANMLKFKAEYIRKLGLGGGMVWALDLDDFSNRCGQGKYPLMRSIVNVLGPKKNAYPGITDGSGLESADKDKPATADKNKPASADKPAIEDKPSAEDKTRCKNVKNAAERKNCLEKDEKSEDYKVVCYFTNWAWYRPGEGKFKPKDIDASLCTHIVYGFAVLNPTKLLLAPHDAWADFDNKFYEEVTALRSQKKKVLLAIGGWNDSQGDKYSRLVSNAEARKKFVEHAVEFLKKHNFDGLDLDWEYPKCWQVDCEKGPEADKANFALWVQELSEAFVKEDLLLTAAVSPAKMVIEQAYDVPKLAKYMDYISVMTYDYHGQWDKKTGHVAPMYHHPLNANEFFNVNFTVHFWLESGLDRQKLIMGIPLYGQSFTLSNTEDNGLGSKTYGGADAGAFTRSRGFLAYHEICYNVKNSGWKVIRDPANRMGPYAFKGNQWVGFDDIDTIKYKTQFIKNMSLGGAMVWALDLDDFNNRCECEQYPLLKTINRGLGLLSSSDAQCDLPGSFRLQDSAEEPPVEVPAAPYAGCDGNNFKAVEGDCTKYQVCNNNVLEEHSCPAGLHWNRVQCDWPEAAKCGQQTEAASGVATEEVGNEVGEGQQQAGAKPEEKPFPDVQVPDTGKKVVCYFTNWAWYRPGVGKFTPDNINPKLCTHINYGFAVLDGAELVMKPHDTWADLDNKFYEKVASLKSKGVKVLIALGGWNDSEGDKYSKLVSNPEARGRFVESALKFVQEYGFEGLDLDWEYPKCWQVNCDAGPSSDKDNFSALVRELSAAFKPKGLLLTAAVSPSKKVIDEGYDVPELNKYLDHINVMTYDYHGHWDPVTGHVAPLHDYEGAMFDYFNAEFTMNYWREKGADPSKLILGVPMYGQAFRLANAANNSLGAAAVGRGEAGEFTRAAGFLAYYEICKKVSAEGWTVVTHPEGAMGPYAFKGDQWVGFDDVATIRKKAQLVADKGYGGAMIWALDLDDFSGSVCGCERYPLLSTINRVLRAYPVAEPQCSSTGSGVSTTPYLLKVPSGYPQPPTVYASNFYVMPVPYQLGSYNPWQQQLLGNAITQK